MTRNEFFSAVAQQSGLSTQQVKTMFDATCDVVTSSLKNEGKIPLGSLGFLKVQQRDARTGRNPRTGEQIQIPAKAVVKFTVASAIEEALSAKK